LKSARAALEVGNSYLGWLFLLSLEYT
jgi:hypothetical protein